MNDPLNKSDLLLLTADIVAAHFAHNTVAINDIPNVIQNVFTSLSTMSGASFSTHPPRPEPAVSIKKSITPDFIICLEDGKKLKMLKRHLKTAYNMSVDEYRERWGLGADYPVVAPNYAKQRSALAKNIGLGTRSRTKKNPA
ncbi:MAG: MucR family transcriptional regulator [Alphaproteobacteria bacterium 16-39-46]|nr:MAG: MucR family transcriptional regulator [Alphaproteobacteria bacterium 16-39-46]OZA43854.1 MAG: MucR family transcriptional regulator [Alphaproteobacteria bacterium 17-39-52]HQS84095.1 MucR family transcriptional regulator [Alphaproteobacteria bacterium]HQS93969.1 MucR family transcriptional regulator [Alphaproteobacteria bacterium]